MGWSNAAWQEFEIKRTIRVPYTSLYIVLAGVCSFEMIDSVYSKFHHLCILFVTLLVSGLVAGTSSAREPKQ
ncbi:MAG: hypothetical protein VX317_01245, partial [Verrucomicrobiota bacterium]|nr:hypothetical protein [Verrucomicrobiota bacterium]